jgi:uroporphyrinogen-III decarboxylase
MNSLQRMMAAIEGKPLDRFPVMNPYPFYSLQPYWPELNGMTYIHPYNGSDEERIGCYRTVHEKLSIDCIPVWSGPSGMQDRCQIENEAGDAPKQWDRVEFPLYVRYFDKDPGERQRFDDFFDDPPVETRKYNSISEVENDPIRTAEETIASGEMEMGARIVADMGDEVFLYAEAGAGAFSTAYRALTFEGVMEEMYDRPEFVHAILQRSVSQSIQTATAHAQTGIHAIRINEYPASADMISEKHFLEFSLPYLKQLIDGYHELGLLVILEFLGHATPRMKHLATLGADVIQLESSMKQYDNSIAECRKLLGDSSCLCGNTPVLAAIEQGDESDWEKDAQEQMAGIGSEGRYIICPGSPTTRATHPEKLLRWAQFLQKRMGNGDS